MSKIFIILSFALIMFFGGGPLHAEDSLLTPFTMKVLAPPVPVKGSDGTFHLVYELKLTNASSFPWQLESLKVFTAKGDKIPLLTWKGDELLKRMELLGARRPTRRLEPSQTAIVWIPLKLASAKEIPSRLIHHLELSSEKRSLTETGGEVEVSREAPIVVHAPLRGDRWIAADGCCESTRHVRALLPVEGRLVTAQRFAIDWERMGEGKTIYKGDPLKPESYFCYGETIYAVADGKVAGAFDGLPNQVPGKLPEGLKPEEADGNHVIQEIAPGRFALYAHMIPGSVKVKAGQTLKQGQEIGWVGNSGNSSAPHLHFHVMDGPEALGSNGLPYVLSQFESKEKVPGTAAFDEAEAKGTPLTLLPVPQPGLHRDELPLDQWVIQFMESPAQNK